MTELNNEQKELVKKVNWLTRNFPIRSFPLRSTATAILPPTALLVSLHSEYIKQVSRQPLPVCSPTTQSLLGRLVGRNQGWSWRFESLEFLNKGKNYHETVNSFVEIVWRSRSLQAKTKSENARWFVSFRKLIKKQKFLIVREKDLNKLVQC